MVHPEAVAAWSATTYGAHSIQSKFHDEDSDGGHVSLRVRPDGADVFPILGDRIESRNILDPSELSSGTGETRLKTR